MMPDGRCIHTAAWVMRDCGIEILRHLHFHWQQVRKRMLDSSTASG